MLDAKRLSLHGSHALDRLRETIFSKTIDVAEAAELQGFAECVLGDKLRTAQDEVFRSSVKKVWDASDVRKVGKVSLPDFQHGAKSLGFDKGVKRIFLLINPTKRGYVATKEFCRKMKYWLERAQRDLPEEEPTLPSVVVPKDGIDEAITELGRMHAAGKHMESAQVAMLSELRQLEDRYATLGHALKVQKGKNEELTTDLSSAQSTISHLTAEVKKMEGYGAELEEARATIAAMEAAVAKERTAYERRILEAERLLEQATASRERDAEGSKHFGSGASEGSKHFGGADASYRSKEDALPTHSGESFRQAAQPSSSSRDRLNGSYRDDGLENGGQDSYRVNGWYAAPYRNNAADLAMENERLVKQVRETETLLDEETQRRQKAESAERQTLERLKIVEDMLARSIGKEKYWKGQNYTLEKSLEYAGNMLHKQRDAMTIQTERRHYDESKARSERPVRKVLRLDGILPRSVCLKAMRYSDAVEVDMAPMSAR